MVEVIPLKYGVTFKRIFSDPEVFSQFASDVLGFPVQVEQVFTEYEYPEAVGYVKIKYDLFAEDINKRTIIEIQHIREDDFFDRFLYYHLVALAEQVRSYYSYRFERSVYTIVVLTTLPQQKALQFSYAASNMSPINEWGEQIAIYPHRLVFLGPRALNDQTPPKARPWLQLIADSLDSQVEATNYDSALFQRIIERMRRTTLSPEELSLIKDEAAWEEAKRNAIAQGIEEGRKQQVMEIGRTMLRSGVEPVFIAQMTGLTLAEIAQLDTDQS